jgi:hypothetical protein
VIGDDKPSLEELAHHGVKGMHWGQHKSIHPSFTPREQASDVSERGKGSLRRINKRLNNGMTLSQARDREDVFQARRAIAIAGATVVVALLAEHGSTNMSAANSFIANKAATNRQAASVLEKTLAIGSKASKTPFVKAGRHGVFKITTL